MRLIECKFTPLGFETGYIAYKRQDGQWGVNLPRWGLKLLFGHSFI